MRRLPLADRLRVKSPCAVPGGWEEMPNGEHGRFCASCDREVHDVSRLTRDEAEALLRHAQKEGERVCVQLHRRRSDGAILLADGHALPERQLAKRRLVSTVAAVSAATLSATALAGCGAPKSPPPATATTPTAPTTPAARTATEPRPRWWADAPPLPMPPPAQKDEEHARPPHPSPSAPAMTTGVVKTPAQKPSKESTSKGGPPKAAPPHPKLYLEEAGYLYIDGGGYL